MGVFLLLGYTFRKRNFKVIAHERPLIVYYLLPESGLKKWEPGVGRVEDVFNLLPFSHRHENESIKLSYSYSGGNKSVFRRCILLSSVCSQVG